MEPQDGLGQPRHGCHGAGRRGLRAPCRRGRGRRANRMRALPPRSCRLTRWGSVRRACGRREPEAQMADERMAAMRDALRSSLGHAVPAGEALREAEGAAPHHRRALAGAELQGLRADGTAVHGAGRSGVSATRFRNAHRDHLRGALEAVTGEKPPRKKRKREQADQQLSPSSSGRAWRRAPTAPSGSC